MPIWLQAGLWGLLAGSALLLGAAVPYMMHVPRRVAAGVMAFGSGVLISAMSFELMDEAYRRGGFDAVSIGFVGGAIVYTIANYILSHRGARHRKRSDQKSESEGSSGTAIAVGALLDGIPESMVIGLSLLSGGAVSWVAVIAIFLSNLPEGLSSASGWKKAGRSPWYTFGVWTLIAVISGAAAMVGYVLFQHTGPNIVSGTTAVAAGAILAMIVDTMIPEAFEETHNFAGLITVVGFLLSFMLSKLGER